MPAEDDPDMTAAELALGLLDGDERAEALRRILAEPDFARDVENWRAHFATLFAESRAIAPPPHLFARIEAALSPRRITRFLWPAVATALAASLIAALLMRPVAVVPPPVYTPALVATLDPATKGTPIVAIYDRARGKIRLRSTGLTAPARSAELWLIGTDGVPHSLGLLSPGERSAIVVNPANQRALDAGTKLAVSSEPVGGSPTGQPTGPILAIGTFISA